jgi:hypothetical protein
MLLPILDQYPVGVKDPIWVYITHMVLKVNMRALAIRSAQIRAARALLRWSAVDLARESSVGVNTIRRAEVAENGTSLTAANELAIRRALEAAGVEFIDENGGGPGVRLRKHQRPKQSK